MGLSALFTMLDFNGYSPSIRIDSKKIYQTVAGGIISLMYFISMSTGIVYFCSQMWTKVDPIVITSTYDVEPYPIPLSDSDFNIYFSIQDKDAYDYVDPQVFTVNAQHIVTKYVNNTFISSTVEVEVKPCKYFYHQSSDLSNDTVIDIENYYCLDPKNVYVQGFWGSEVNSYITIRIEKCSNSSISMNCLPEDKINDKLGYVSFYFRSNLVYSSNYSDPLYAVLEDNYNRLNKDLSFDVVLYLKSLEYSTDSGFFLENSQILKSFFVEGPVYNYYVSDDRRITTIDIKGHRIGEVYKRSYLKIQDVVTKIGGLAKVLAILANTLSFHISLLAYDIKILESVFSHFKRTQITSKVPLRHIQLFHESNNQLYLNKTENLKTCNREKIQKSQIETGSELYEDISFYFKIKYFISKVFQYKEKGYIRRLVVRIRKIEKTCLSIESMMRTKHLTDLLGLAQFKQNAFSTEIESSYFRSLTIQNTLGGDNPRNPFDLTIESFQSINQT